MINESIPFKQIKNNNATYTVEGYEVGVISVGNPHAVLIVDNINEVNVEEIGKKIQSSAYFPEGVNVNFVEVIDNKNIKLRVYERGVGETLACGSGACATVSYLNKIKKVNNLVNIELKGGKLQIEMTERGIKMLGDAHFVFDGTINYE